MGALSYSVLFACSIVKVCRSIRRVLLLCGVCLVTSSSMVANNVTFPSFQSEAGYLATLLVNEVSFPGERGYISEADAKRAMANILLVLDARIKYVPVPYKRVEIAQTSSAKLLDVMTAGGVHGQIEGFYRDGSGAAVVVPRIQQRMTYLMKIAEDGAPGRFASLLNYAGSIASGYVAQLNRPENLFIDLRQVHGTPVTGRAYSWMTDRHNLHSGGNFVRIPNNLHGSLAGNRFFTLKDLTR